MTIKVLINELGQHLIADVKQVTDTQTEQIVAYWLKDARMVSYTRAGGEDQSVVVNFMKPCPLSDDVEYSVSAHHIVSILTPKQEVLEGYLQQVTPLTPDEGVLVTEGEEATVVGEDGLLPKPERPVVINPEVL